MTLKQFLSTGLSKTYTIAPLRTSNNVLKNIKAAYALSALALFLISTTLHGQLRFSSNYAIETETLNSGGGIGTSENYSASDSLEPMVQGTSSKDHFWALHGFINFVTIESLSVYDVWARSRGLIEGLNAGPLDDPNEDSWPNFFHFAFNTNPLGKKSFEEKRGLATLDINGLEFLTITIPMRTGTTIAINPLLAYEVDGIRYTILGTNDILGPWDLAVVEVIPALTDGRPSLENDINGWQYRTFRLTTPLSMNTHQFLKVGITLLPPEN